MSHPPGVNLQSASVMLEPAWIKASRGIINAVTQIQIGKVGLIAVPDQA